MNLQTQPAKPEATGKGARSVAMADLEAALRLPGCPICRAISSAERESIWSLLRDGVTSLDLRNRFFRGAGFCSRHFWTVAHIEKQFWPSGGFGLAILCEQLLARTDPRTQQIEKISAQKPRLAVFRNGVEKAIDTRVQCQFCAENDKDQALYLNALERRFEERPMNQLSFSATPMCLQHAREALSRWQNEELKNWLRRSVTAYAAELKADAQEFINNHDHKRRNVSSAREGNIVERARHFFLGWHAI